jgi:hypothetical protein
MRETSTTHGFGRVVIKTFFGLRIGIGGPNISAKPMNIFAYRSNRALFPFKSSFRRAVGGLNPVETCPAYTPFRNLQGQNPNPGQRARRGKGAKG